MTRAVVNVATGRYVRGSERLLRALGQHTTDTAVVLFQDAIPKGSPTHVEKPYAFKAYALQAAAPSYDLLLWADASILPIRSLEPLWWRIEQDGYWMSRNGWSNYEWTADSAYPDLFPEFWQFDPNRLTPAIDDARYINRRIEHVVATTFGLNLRHPKGRAFLDEYYRLASETRAFCGPWSNSNEPSDSPFKPNTDRMAPCGPPDVRGHRHDQTAASVIAWRLGFELTSAPNIFAYRGGETEKTILVADGAY